MSKCIDGDTGTEVEVFTAIRVPDVHTLSVRHHYRWAGVYRKDIALRTVEDGLDIRRQGRCVFGMRHSDMFSCRRSGQLARRTGNILQTSQQVDIYPRQTEYNDWLLHTSGKGDMNRTPAGVRRGRTRTRPACPTKLQVFRCCIMAAVHELLELVWGQKRQCPRQLSASNSSASHGIGRGGEIPRT